jgi:small nuclear ribonucleoprotein
MENPLKYTVNIVMFLSQAQRVARTSFDRRPYDVTSVMVITMNAGRPMELLQHSIGDQVLVELKGKKIIKGKLRGYDQHLNLILEDAEEISNNPETGDQIIEVVKTVILRGDNVVIVSPPPK